MRGRSAARPGTSTLLATIAVAISLVRPGLALALGAAVAVASDSALGRSDADPASWRSTLAAALDARRAELGLGAVVSSEALTRAAQAQADEMATGGWFDLTSPAGVTVEARVEAAGYAAELVAAKVYRAPLAESAAALEPRWWGDAAASRQSVFHSGVRDVGIGVATSSTDRFFVFVLARRPGPGAVPPSLGADLEGRRTAFRAAVDVRRAEHGLGPLRADPALDRATQEHAEALLAALRAGRPASSVASLASRLETNAIGNPAIMAVGKANAGGSAAYQQKTPGREGGKLGGGALGEAIVVDAMSAARAVDAAEREGESALVAPGYVRVGVGVAIDMSGPAPHVVWVACATRK
jgi:uncharacterized protein YkwD